MSQPVNNFTLTGNISQVPEIRTTQNGKKYAFISIAVNGMNKDTPDFISFVIWDKTAENVVKYCGKGDCISVMGHISTFKKEEKTQLQLTADAVTFIHKAQKKQAPATEVKFEPANDTFQPAGNSGDIFAPF